MQRYWGKCGDFISKNTQEWENQSSKTIAQVTKRLNGGLCERREESNEADVEYWSETSSAHAYWKCIAEIFARCCAEYLLWRYKYPKNISPKICGPTDVSRGSDSDDLVTKNSQTIACTHYNNVISQWYLVKTNYLQSVRVTHGGIMDSLAHAHYMFSLY